MEIIQCQIVLLANIPGFKNIYMLKHETNGKD